MRTWVKKAPAFVGLLMVVICGGQANAQTVAAGATVAVAAGDDSMAWGELSEGLQMNAVFNPDSLTVTCKIRNGCTETVGYNEYFLGYCGSIWAEIKCDDGWKQVKCAENEMGVGPNPDENRIAQPGELLPMGRYCYPRGLNSFLVDFTVADWPDTIVELTTLEFRIVHAVSSYVYGQNTRNSWHFIEIRSMPIRIDDPAVIRKLTHLTGDRR